MIESLSWSPDGRAILLGVAGSGADVAGAQGSGTMKAKHESLPSWMPHVEAGEMESHWRRLWLYDLETQTSRVLSREGLNVWEAVWAGPQHLIAIVSSEPGESA